MPPRTVSRFLLYQSERLNAYTEQVIHGFTGKPLSMGGPGFSREEILANRQHVCQTMGMTGARLVVPEQVHSANIRLNTDTGFCRTDAVIVTEPGIPAFVQTADCVPVILYDPARHVGAVIHSGWRGTAQGITALTARTLFEGHGCAPDNLIAVIGPAIGGCCYEVSPEVVEAVCQSIPRATETVVRINPNGRPRIDLKAVNHLQLASLGVTQIETLPDCTRCDTDVLWSYRRGESGRQAAFLELRPQSS